MTKFRIRVDFFYFAPFLQSSLIVNASTVFKLFPMLSSFRGSVFFCRGGGVFTLCPSSFPYEFPPIFVISYCLIQISFSFTFSWSLLIFSFPVHFIIFFNLCLTFLFHFILVIFVVDVFNLPFSSISKYFLSLFFLFFPFSFSLFLAFNFSFLPPLPTILISVLLPFSRIVSLVEFLYCWRCQLVAIV